MGKIEAQRARVFARQRRFAILVAGKDQSLGWRIEIMPEDFSQNSASGREAHAMTLEVKTIRALEFVRGQDCTQVSKVVRGDVKLHYPDVNMISAQFHLHDGARRWWPIETRAPHDRAGRAISSSR